MNGPRVAGDGPFVRIADWINDPNLIGTYFGRGGGFSRLTEKPVFRFEARSPDVFPEFHWYMGAGVVRQGWVDLCRDLDPEAIEIIPIDVFLGNGEPAGEQFYAWDVVRMIDAVDWERSNATVIKGELHGEDYTREMSDGSSFGRIFLTAFICSETKSTE